MPAVASVWARIVRHVAVLHSTIHYRIVWIEARCNQQRRSACDVS
jgi:hypothetical protein